MTISRPLLAALLAMAVAVPGARVAGSPPDAPPLGWDEYVRPWLEGQGGPARGLIVFPAELLGGRAVEILAPQGFRLHMTRANEPGEEIVHAAGEPLSAPAGVWRMWLESDWSITPYTSIVSVASQAPPRVVPQWFPVGPGGRVTVADEQGARPEHELWVLRLERSAARGPNEFSRRRPVGELADGLLMPAGAALAGLREPDSGRYVALSRPFSIVGETAKPAPLERPARDAAHFVLHAAHPGSSWAEPTDGLLPIIEQSGRRREPEIVLPTEGGLYAVWYDLRPGLAVLSGGDRRLYLPTQTFELVGGTIESADTVLRRRPALTVALALPDLPHEKPAVLAVSKLPEEVELARRELRSGTTEVRIEEGLVHGTLAVVLETSFGRERRTVDLTAADEGHVTIAPPLIEVYGTVRFGDEPRPATLLFRTLGGDTREAAADENGEYRVFSLQPLIWVQVEVEHVEQEPWHDLLMPPIRTSRQLDVEIADASVVVRVVDARTGQGIAGASVDVRSEYSVRTGSDGEESDGRGARPRAIGQSHPTDDDGVARLPSPRPGRLEISASASHYLPLVEPVLLEIPDPPVDREVELRLEPHGDGIQVRLRLRDGSPAAGAEVMRVASLAGGEVLFSGRADADGLVEVPVEPPHGELLLRHPAAASAVVDWRQWQGDTAVEWTFPRAAALPLSIRAVSPPDQRPARGAAVCLWVGERAFSGPLLHWLWQAGPRTDGSGFWTAHRLPREAVRVASTAGGSPATLCSHPNLATELAYPWPPTVDLPSLHVYD